MISYTATTGIIINVIICVVSLVIIVLSVRGISIKSSKLWDSCREITVRQKQF